MFQKKMALILAVLLVLCFSLTFVSASDDGGLENYTMADAESEDLSLDYDDRSDDVLNTGEKEPQSYIYCPDSVRIGEGSDMDEFSFAEVSFFESDIGGKLEFYVDNVLKDNRSVKPYQSNYFQLSTLDVSVGIHNLTIKYSGDDNFAPFEKNYTFDLYYMKSAVPETVKEGGYNDFAVIFAMDAKGYMDLFIDGKKITTYDVYKERYDELNDEMSPLLCCNVWEFTSFARHNYTLNYYNGNYANKSINGTFNLDYTFDVNKQNIPYFGDSAKFIIYLPEDANNNISVVANGKSYSVKNERELDYINWEFDELAYGKNNFTFTYEDEKYYKKTFNTTIDVSSRISTPDYTVSYGSDNGNVTLILPENAKGNLTVYTNSWDSPELFANVKLINGKASISLSNMALGGYGFIANYTGDDYDVSSTSFNFSLIPNIDYPKGIWAESNDEYKITVKSPSDASGKLVISIYNATFYEEYVQNEELFKEIYIGTANGTVSAAIPKLKTGFYNIKVEYYIGQYSSNVWNNKLTVYQEPSNWTMNVDVPEEITKADARYSEFGFYPNYVPKGADGFFKLYIDGKYVDFHLMGDDGEFDYYLNELDIGTHTWKVTFSGDSYYDDGSCEGSIIVSWAAVPKEVICGDTVIKCFIDDDATGYVTLLIDGNEYSVDFLNKGEISILLDNITPGAHSYELTYSGDSNHQKLTKTGSFNVVSVFEIEGIANYDSLPLKESYEVYAKLASDATGSVEITVAGQNYTSNVLSGVAMFNIKNLTAGAYTLVAKYSGDGKYSSRETSVKFNINDYYQITGVYDDSEDEDFPLTVAILLELPSDATGNLTLIDINNNVIARAKLENGSATIVIADLNLPFNRYEGNAIYESENKKYNVQNYCFDFKVEPDVNVSSVLKLGENATVEMDLMDAEGNITIYVNGEIFKKEMIKNGKLNVVVPADNLKLGENSIGFKYEGNNSYLTSYFAYEGLDEYAPYSVLVKPNELNIPNEFKADGSGNITLELPEGASGNVSVYVDDELISTTPVTGGNNVIPVSGLSQGNHKLRVEYTDGNGDKYTSSSKTLVPKPQPSIEVTVPASSASPEFSVVLPNNATGSVIVTINGKNYPSNLVNGKTTFTIPNLADGTYNLTVKYSGDGNYCEVVKNTTVTIKTTSNVTPSNTTNTTSSTPKADVIKLTLKKVKVKRSAKKLVIKATLKINGKAVKGKKLKFKFNKKTYTAKTNKKGVAKITIKKKVLKKLKKGKKVKYQVSYGKKTVKRTAKVKK